MTHFLSKCALCAMTSATCYTCAQLSSLDPFVYSRSTGIWYTKLFLLLLPITSIIIWHFLSLLQKHPEWHIYGALNSENKELFYYNSSYALYLLKNSFLIVASCKTMNDVWLAQGHGSLFNGYGAMIVVVSALFLIVYFIVHTAKKALQLSQHFEH